MSVPFITTQIPKKKKEKKSVYFSLNELKTKMISSGYTITNEEQYRKWFKTVENLFQDFFIKVLETRAKKSGVENKILFNRENLFSNMFCFAKKLYIGAVIDNEGALYPLDNPKHKIMGVPIKQAGMPDFCKVAAEKLAFDICKGLSYDEAANTILDVYKQFKEAGTDVVASKKSISNYKKYIPYTIDYYLKHGLVFEKGMTFNAKCSLAYNYIIAKNKFKLSPINNNTKFNYMYVKPNEYNIEAIAYIGNWPDELASILEVDYETMFRKSFIPLFEKMFQIANWIGKKDSIMLEKPGMFDFFS